MLCFLLPFFGHLLKKIQFPLILPKTGHNHPALLSDYSELYMPQSFLFVKKNNCCV